MLSEEMIDRAASSGIVMAATAGNDGALDCIEKGVLQNVQHAFIAGFTFRSCRLP